MEYLGGLMQKRNTLMVSREEYIYQLLKTVVSRWGGPHVCDVKCTWSTIGWSTGLT
jgi:predicted SpoU family rRNA methylase